MKRIFFAVLVLAGVSFAQAGRFDTVLSSSTYINGVKTITPLNGATVSICKAPANATPCTNYATIYTDSTATTTVAQPGVTADSNGNAGFWALPGQYQYTYSYLGQNFGPYSVTIGTSVAPVYYDAGSKGVVCDQVTDTTAAVAALFSTIATAGASAKVVFPQGGCKITSTITLEHMPPLIIEGVGGNETVKSGSNGAPTGSFFINAIPGGVSPVFWIKYSAVSGQIITQNITMRDFGITGSPAGTGYGIFADGYGSGDVFRNLNLYQLAVGLKGGNDYSPSMYDMNFMFDGKAIWNPVGSQTFWAIHNALFRSNTNDLYLEAAGASVDGHSFFESSTQTSVYLRGGALEIRESHFECGPQTAGYRIDAADDGAGNRVDRLVLTDNWFSVGCIKPAGNIGIYLHSSSGTNATQAFNIVQIKGNHDQGLGGSGVSSLTVGAMGASAQMNIENNIFDGTVSIDANFIGQLKWMNNYANGDYTPPTAAGASPYIVCPGTATYPYTVACDFEPAIYTTLISKTANPASAGFIRGAKTDTLKWRNNANSGDLPLGIDSSDRLTFNGFVVRAPLYNAAGILQDAVHSVKDTCTLGTNCAVTFSGSAVFTSSSSYDCWARDATTAANAVTIARGSGSAVTFTGTGTDVINYFCVGN